MSRKGDDFEIKITEKGRKKVTAVKFGILQVPRPKRWNGHWWVVLADIPTAEHRGQADLFRQKLKAMGFYLLQRTVWAYPFDPRDEIDFVSAHYGINQFVTVMEVVTLHADDKQILEKHFKNSGKI